MQLTLQACNDGSWQDAYRLKIEQKKWRLLT